MQIDEREKLNRVENLKRKFLDINFKTKIKRHEGFSQEEVGRAPDSWESEENRNIDFRDMIIKKTSIFKKFFIFSIIFFILAASYASYMLFIKNNTISSDNIDIAILGNSFTAGGEDLPLQVEITNKNNASLEFADLLIEYPRGVLDEDLERIRLRLGIIPAGSTKIENVKVIVFGEQGSVRKLKFFLEYRVEGSNAIFLKEKPYEVAISSAPLDLSVDAPIEVSSNQNFNFNIKTTLNATKTTSKILVRVDYPVGFEFNSANPAPSFGNNIWNLGDLSPGAIKDISINGRMVDIPDGEEKTFHVFSGSQSDSDKAVLGVVFNSLGHSVLIKKPFIEAQLYVNGDYQKEYSVSSNASINGEIRWRNNLDTAISDMQISAKISGNALNRNKISSSTGYYNSSIDTIIWDKNSEYDFSEVSPGDTGSVSFSLSPLSLFSSSAGLLNDPKINVEISISGKQSFDGNSLKELKNSETKVIKIISDIGFNSKALYYSGPFTNSGPIPPRVEQPTSYTIVWSLFNSSNSFSNVKISTILPQWMEYSSVFSPGTEDLKYNSSTRELIWNVGSVAKGTGISGAGKEISFQVILNPSLSQVGTSPVILNDAVLTGHDDFANVDVRVNRYSLNTRLSSDPNFPDLGDRVAE